jgi:hypothetical protein
MCQQVYIAVLQHLRRSRIALVLAAFLLGACGGNAGRPANIVTQQQSVGQLMIALETPERPPLLTEQQVVVKLTDTGGAPVDQAEVWLALVMPTMQMSPNEPDAAPAGGGQYRANVIFTMSGTWNLEVHTVVRGQEYIAIFHTQAS